MDEGKNVITLKHWCLISKDKESRLVGNCYGHHKFPDGSFVNTSKVISAEGRYVKTISGSIYYLDDPIEEYVAHVNNCGYLFDPEDPIIEL